MPSAAIAESRPNGRPPPNGPLAPDPAWAPRWYTPALTDCTRGDDVVAYAAGLLHVFKGLAVRPGGGLPALTMPDWQSWLSRALLEESPTTRLLRYRKALVGVARKNGKSLIGASIALWALTELGYGIDIFSVAGDRKQAGLVFREARQQVMNQPALKKIVKPYKDALENLVSGSVYRVLSADADLAQGTNPSITLFDEVHVQKSHDLWDAMAFGSDNLAESLLIGITTAGEDLDSLCGQLFTYGCKIASGEVTDDTTFGLFWWASHLDTPDVMDVARWREANPMLAVGLMSEDSVRSTARSSSRSSFYRFKLNLWVDHHGLGWMNMAAFDKAARPDRIVEPGTEIVMAFDGSVDDDSTVVLGMTMDGHAFIIGIWEKPEIDNDEWRVPRSEVDRTVRQAFDTYKVRQLGCDRSQWESEFAAWTAEWGEERVIEVPRQANYMAPATDQTYADIVTEDGAVVVTHDGHPALRRHVANAITKDTAAGTVIRKESRRSHRKIDAAVTLIMANSIRRRAPELVDPVTQVW